MDLGKLLSYLYFDTYVMIKCNGDVIAEGYSVDIADNALNAEMWGCYDIIDMYCSDNRLIINVAEGEY